MVASLAASTLLPLVASVTASRASVSVPLPLVSLVPPMVGAVSLEAFTKRSALSITMVSVEPAATVMT